MGVFACTACKAKDEEIAWLRNRVETLEKDVLAVADKRAASLRSPRVQTPMAPPPMSPGMARAGYYDPDEPKNVPPPMDREAIERGFVDEPTSGA